MHVSRTVRSLVVLAVVLLFGLAAVPAAAIQIDPCDCEVEDAVAFAADDAMRLTASQRRKAERVHLPWGMPVAAASADNEVLLHSEHYVLAYDGDLRTPLWGAYRLTATDVSFDLDRTECFRIDPRLDAEVRSDCDDYEEPVFDRGHVVPSDAMSRSLEAMINTYVFSNMTPQHANFNRFLWQQLERYVREWAEQHNEIFVITGAVFDRDGDGVRDPDDEAVRMSTGGVAVASHFYKIVLHEGPAGRIEAIAFVIPHNNDRITGDARDPFLMECVRSIDEIESLTGIDFSPEMDSLREMFVEQSKARRLWFRESIVDR